MLIVDPVNPAPRVSVCMVTYNQEKYIAQAIESALMQETSFDYELVIGDDCSTDGTREIVKEYAAKYPDKIETLLHPQNLGPAHSPGGNNFVATLGACQGQFVALLEGDDYWTSPHKLQKQVDFLDGHPQYAICFHNAKEVYENGEREPWNYCRTRMKKSLTLTDLLVSNFIPTCSVMFRRGLFAMFPDWYFQCKFGDWPLHILNAQHGSIGYLNHAMAVHRRHVMGIWSSQDDLPKLAETIRFYSVIRSYLGSRYEQAINVGLSRVYYHMAVIHCDLEDYPSAKKAIVNSLHTGGLKSPFLSWQFLRTFALSIIQLG